MSEASKSVHIRIEGIVQGVGYRQWTKDTAKSLGVSGWVRNCADSTVEAVFTGPEPAVDEMLKLSADGPASARVARIDIMSEPAGAFDGFEIKPAI